MVLSGFALSLFDAGHLAARDRPASIAGVGSGLAVRDRGLGGDAAGLPRDVQQPQHPALRFDDRVPRRPAVRRPALPLLVEGHWRAAHVDPQQRVDNDQPARRYGHRQRDLPALRDSSSTGRPSARSSWPSTFASSFWRSSTRRSSTSGVPPSSASSESSRTRVGLRRRSPERQRVSTMRTPGWTERILRNSGPPSTSASAGFSGS